MPIQPKQQPPYYETTNATVKTYKAICTQTGTNPPVPNILINTLNLPNLDWFYDAQGSFSFGEFPENLTIFTTITGDSTTARILNAGNLQDDQYVIVKNSDANGTTQNDITFTITIEIYP